MSICGKCNRELDALTTRGLCLQCDLEVTKELREEKNKLLKTIYDNNFNLELICKITKKSINDIREFIKNNNIKKMNNNNYTCSSCGKSTNQIFSRYERTGLCEICVNKIVKNKKTASQVIKEPDVEGFTIDNSLLAVPNQNIPEPNIDYIEHTKVRKPVKIYHEEIEDETSNEPDTIEADMYNNPDDNINAITSDISDETVEIKPEVKEEVIEIAKGKRGRKKK